MIDKRHAGGARLPGLQGAAERATGIESPGTGERRRLVFAEGEAKLSEWMWMSSNPLSTGL